MLCREFASRLIAVNPRTAQSPDIEVPMRALLAGARRKETALVDLARKLVQAESPSDVKAAVDACAAIAIKAGR